MNNSHLFIAFLLLLALILTFFFPPVPALADDHCWVEYAWADCNDGNLFNGYWWREEGFVPGMITRETHFLPAPPYTKGWAVYYAKGVMEATARVMNFSLDGYLDGVAMMSCADIGQTIWIHRIFADDWEGPFLVVDCAEWDDHYPVTIFRGEVIEVGFQTAKRWGILDDWKTAVFVLKSRFRPPKEFRQLPITYSEWFAEIAKYYSHARVELPPRYIYDGNDFWYIDGRWKSFLARWNNPMYIEPWIRDLIYRKD